MEVRMFLMADVVLCAVAKMLNGKYVLLFCFAGQVVRQKLKGWWF